MFKKIICCLLAAIILTTLSGCFEAKKPEFPSFDESTTSLPNSSASSNTTTESDKNTTTSKPTQSKPTQSKPTQSKPAQNSSVGVVVEKPTQTVTSENTSVSSPTIEAPVVPNTPHTPLSKDKYYQYSTLNEKGKEIYKKIANAIETTQNVVNLKAYGIDFDTLWGIYQKVIADNPQYFWVSKFITYTETSQNGSNSLVDLYISYTDGNVTDTFNDDNQLSVTADREKIQKQINDLNLKSEEILKKISASLPDVEKEKLIHDAVLETVSYDFSSTGKTPTRNNYPRVWDIYGALYNQKAVCEGYAKLFQYLCYQAGLNANYVCGVSEGQNHGWNVVLIDGDWYFVDTTWDDGSTDNPPIPIYTYFNLTLSQITKDHIIDDSTLSVPVASSEKYAFNKTFGMNITSPDLPPENFEKAIDFAIKYDEDYLICSLNGLEIDFDYIEKYFQNPKSDIQIYLKSKGKNLKFNSMITLSGHLYLKFK